MRKTTRQGLKERHVTPPDMTTFSEIPYHNMDNNINKSKTIKLSNNLEFHKLTKRRDFYDFVLEYIKENERISRQRILAYLKYRVGVSELLIYDALNTLEELELIQSEDEGVGGGYFLVFYRYVGLQS